MQGGEQSTIISDLGDTERGLTVKWELRSTLAFGKYESIERAML